MADIIAGRFESQPDADRAIEALRSAGFGPNDLTCFYLNPPGRHATYPIGGDTHHDAGTKDAGRTAAAGSAVGGLTGLAVGTAAAAAAEPGFTAVAALAGAGVGAYVGSLAGGLTGAHGAAPGEGTTEEPIERDAGVMVAVRIDRTVKQQEAIDTLRAHGAQAIERANGAWVDGGSPAWTDFDPRTSPRLISP